MLEANDTGRDPLDAPSSTLPRRAMLGLLARDFHVLRRDIYDFLARTIVQPLLVIFVFVYLMPRVRGGQGFEGYGTVIAPGLIGFGAIFTAVHAIGMPMAVDFSYAREVDDRARAPLSAAALGFERLLFGAVQAIVACVVVIGACLTVGSIRSTFEPRVGLVVLGVLFAAVGAASFGLAIGSLVRPAKLAGFFGLIIIPLMYLGCSYFSWQSLDEVRWLQVVALLNPLVYINELLRAALTPQEPHMAVWQSVLGGVVVDGALVFTGVRAFERRLTE